MVEYAEHLINHFGTKIMLTQFRLFTSEYSTYFFCLDILWLARYLL